MMTARGSRVFSMRLIPAAEKSCFTFCTGLIFEKLGVMVSGENTKPPCANWTVTEAASATRQAGAAHLRATIPVHETIELLTWISVCDAAFNRRSIRSRHCCTQPVLPQWRKRITAIVAIPDETSRLRTTLPFFRIFSRRRGVAFSVLLSAIIFGQSFGNPRCCLSGVTRFSAVQNAVAHALKHFCFLLFSVSPCLRDSVVRFFNAWSLEDAQLSRQRRRTTDAPEPA